MMTMKSVISDICGVAGFASAAYGVYLLHGLGVSLVVSGFSLIGFAVFSGTFGGDK